MTGLAGQLALERNAPLRMEVKSAVSYRTKAYQALPAQSRVADSLCHQVIAPISMCQGPEAWVRAASGRTGPCTRGNGSATLMGHSLCTQCNVGKQYERTTPQLPHLWNGDNSGPSSVLMVFKWVNWYLWSTRALLGTQWVSSKSQRLIQSAGCHLCWERWGKRDNRIKYEFISSLLSLPNPFSINNFIALLGTQTQIFSHLDSVPLVTKFIYSASKMSYEYILSLSPPPVLPRSGLW